MAKPVRCTTPEALTVFRLQEESIVVGDCVTMDDGDGAPTTNTMDNMANDGVRYRGGMTTPK
jgi:hypothetical protein